MPLNDHICWQIVVTIVASLTLRSIHLTWVAAFIYLQTCNGVLAAGVLSQRSVITDLKNRFLEMRYD